MHPRTVFLFVWLAAACGGGRMRVAEGEPENDTPVSLAPEPEGVRDSSLNSTPSATAPAPIQDTTPAEQGYAAYDTTVSSTGLEIRRIGKWSHTGIREARRMVIQDVNAWAEFWSELGVGDRPAVDFTRDIVISVAAGERPSGGHEIAVSRVTKTDGEIRVEVSETAPGPNCLSTANLTQPVDVVIVEGVKPKSWSFVEHKDVRNCTP